ncbi:MAG: hypothetical protein D6719_00625 [Candidatus Dadabacteria bacterium]|nr:MAG: hypothetical protein D6719_00625 [Candidatus Dadabacteria bacterium]
MGSNSNPLANKGSGSKNLMNTPLLVAVESYISYYASGSGHTARAKRLDLDKFVTFLTSYKGYSKPEKLKLKDWDFSSVQRFVDERLKLGEAPSTVARRLATIKHMGRTMAEKIAGFVNPAREVKAPKTAPPCPKALSRSEIKSVRKRAILRLNDKDSFIRKRNKVLFEFLLDTGLRADEVRLLKLSQIDDNLEWISNVRTKGRRYRNVYITSKVRPILKQYLEERERELKRFYKKLPKARSRALPLFISTYNADPAKPESFLMGAKTIWRAINELSTETHLHPHLLRHSYALDLLSTSKDVRLVSQALGHSDVRITMRYTERNEQEIARALEKSRRRKSA